MGGGGSYYDRDVVDKRRVSSKGYSDDAEARFSRSGADKAVMPKGRRLVCRTKSPLVSAFDVTGSMGTLPKIISDKWPMVVGQLTLNDYLDDPMLSIAAVGDILSDTAPIQIADFCALRSLDNWSQRIWLEGNGGGQAKESYEMTAYFYARMCEIPNAKTPIFIFTGDEGFREELLNSDLAEYFGGKHETVDARIIFEELKKQFLGNVFLIHRRYDSGRGSDTEIVRQWESALGKERIVHLKNDRAVADLTLGIIAMASGSRTLEAYIEDMKNRPLDLGGIKYEPQSPERIAEVKKSLEPLYEYLESQGRFSVAPKTRKKAATEPTDTEKAGVKESKTGTAKPRPKKAGRL